MTIWTWIIIIAVLVVGGIAFVFVFDFSEPTQTPATIEAPTKPEKDPIGSYKNSNPQSF